MKSCLSLCFLPCLAVPFVSGLPFSFVGSEDLESPRRSWMASRCALYIKACRSAPEKPSVRAAMSDRREEMDD